MWCSANILAQPGWGPEVKDYVGRALNEGGEKTLRVIALIVKRVWGAESVSVLLTRLSKPLTPGCEHIYEPLVKLARSEQYVNVRETVFNGLRHESPTIAKEAADALAGNPEIVGKQDVALLDQMLDHWTRQGSWCDRCNVAVPQYSCPKCHFVMPSPRGALTQQLIDLQALSQERLLLLCGDNNNDVAAATRRWRRQFRPHRQSHGKEARDNSIGVQWIEDA
jgi:hypothetical protein